VGPEGGTAYRYLLKDPADIPFAKFKFHYGTGASLSAQNLIADRPNVFGAGKKRYGVPSRPRLPSAWTSAGTASPSPSKFMCDDIKKVATPIPAPTQPQSADHRWSTLSLTPSLKQSVDEGGFDSDPVEMGTASLVHVLSGQGNKNKGKARAASDDLATVVEEEEDGKEDLSPEQTDGSLTADIGGIVVHREFTMSSWHLAPDDVSAGSGSGVRAGLTPFQWAEPSPLTTLIHGGRQPLGASGDAPAMATDQASSLSTVGRRV